MFIQYVILLVIFYHSKLNGNILLSASTRKKTTKSIISFVANRVYMNEMLCRLDFLSETEYNLYNHVKKFIYFYSSVMGHLNENVINKIFVDFSKTI